MPLIMPKDELISDLNNDNPVVGLKGTLSLKGRFKDRLSRLLGRAISLSDADSSQPLHIYVGSKSRSSASNTMHDGQVRKFSPQKEEASQDQWDLILVHVPTKIHNTIMRLREVFNNYRSKFDTMITQIMGLDDVDGYGSSLDTDLGDLIILLQQLANS
ncbi:uncharacterized protein M421DRAFT_6807 [Didymella exigua CBS 183.55]|uniref:Uncharacterized protein n=1 Tax=Didymella exigua CBS 183.55 TaxID=1150837 RepID=A0A6A5RHG0_9PLEO|nr:uncharacterized protein M421DRAFT_6807 [Didymella exigua CBS 183.55]KAF1926524.1 hypothetical protein M421DRAFT_6807 [Didymella exigua CBS 183.55]